jgi:hypothetical protein
MSLARDVLLFLYSLLDVLAYRVTFRWFAASISRFIRHNLDEQVPVPGAIKLAEEDTLPGSQN